MNRVHMMRVWKMNMGEVMEQIPKVELTGLDDICKVSNMDFSAIVKKIWGRELDWWGGGRIKKIGVTLGLDKFEMRYLESSLKYQSKLQVKERKSEI